jgi:hypothetical protein
MEDLPDTRTGDRIIAEKVWSIFRNYAELYNNKFQARIFPGEYRQYKNRVSYIEKHINNMICDPVYKYTFCVTFDDEIKIHYMIIDKIKC